MLIAVPSAEARPYPRAKLLARGGLIFTALVAATFLLSPSSSAGQPAALEAEAIAPAESTGSCPWSASLLPWSSPGSWPSGAVPSDGDVVSLTQPMLLDVDTARLGGLEIQQGGRLVFMPASALTLTTNKVRLMHGGSLVVGDQACEYTGEARIVLTGSRDSADPKNKGIFVEAGGSLEMRGKAKSSWTQLTRTLAPGAGSMTLHLAEAVSGWEAGDRLVIASSENDLDQAEEVVVESCSGASCTVSGEIKHTHSGEVADGVDMRAEVGLLTRNIKISGEVPAGPTNLEAQDDTNFGAHIKADTGADAMRISGVEVTASGQHGVKGTYPIHWHMLGRVDAANFWGLNNSIHHNFQRCLTLHGVHGVTLAHNVAHETLGHCYFMEDGVERDNTLHRNLGLGTRPGIPPYTIPSDDRPATFWITSPLNELTANRAAGSAATGIWYGFADSVTGLTAAYALSEFLSGLPTIASSLSLFGFKPGESFRTPIMTMEDNAAHSNGQAGFVFGEELSIDQDALPASKCDPRTDPLDPASPSAAHQVTRLSVFKNAGDNIRNSCKSTLFPGLKSSDA